MPSPPNAPPDTEAVEVAELVDFLQGTPPFDALDRTDVVHAARRLEITYARAGTTVLDLDADTEHLFLLRTGAVELHDADDALVARLGEREFFGYPSLLTDSPARRRVTTIEDSLLYLIPETVFDRLRSRSDAFDRFFARAHADRIRDALREERRNVPLTTSLRSLLRRAPVVAAPSVSIQEAAQIMSEARVSSLLLRTEPAGDSDASDGPTVSDGPPLDGIVTDRDLRMRVVAAGVDPSRPVTAVMTSDPVTIDADRYAFEALLVMSRHNVHHLPVTDDGALAGMVTTTDLMRLQTDNPVYLVGEVWKQKDVDGLVRVSRRLPQVVEHLVAAHTPPDDVSRVVTAVSDALTQRLLELAEARLGPPPSPYAWLALGSQARHEQSAHSDQDNALLLPDDASDADRDGYFQRLAAFVCDGLDAAGFVYCPGDVMATTDRWRQPLARWKSYFSTWIEEPKPKALMHSSIFFDMRPVAGDNRLTRSLRRFILDRTASNTIFLASLTVNALEAKPPLGFFRQFVLEEHGGHDDTLDLKINGVVPIVDVARIYALAHGVDAVNTLERLDALARGRHMASSDAADLRDAYTFIARVRLDHQARQIRRGVEPDNYVSPDALSDFDKRHLKDAFKIVSRMQTALSQRYQTDFIS